MKRVILGAMILLGATFAAHADNDVWNDITGQNRGDHAATRAAEYCAWKVGPTINGVPTSAATKRCMRSQGWTFNHTDLEPWTWRHRHHYWRYSSG
ncbi:MAG: hypothetical protein JO000_25905 [Alphaproteobacteria bacterium]|nr:hypothetical protein [Alphaproteobacteria bacterium]